MRGLIQTQPLTPESETLANFGSRGYLLKYNDKDGVLTAADALAGQNNNDTAQYFNGGNATIAGAGTPLATDIGFVTPNGTDNLIVRESNLLRDAFDLKTMVRDSSDHIVIVYGIKGGQPTADEFLMNHGDQWNIDIDSSGVGRTQLVIKAGTTLTTMNGNPTPNMLDGSYHNVLLDLYFTDDNTFACQRWIDGIAGPGWTVDMTGQTINTYDEARDHHILSNHLGTNMINANASSSAIGYQGIFRIQSNILSAVNSVALDWHKSNPLPAGNMPAIMADY